MTHARGIHAPIRAVLVDVETGRIGVLEEVSAWDLCESNWSCDCNRWRAFGEKPAQQDERYCVGEGRFVVVSAPGALRLGYREEDLNCFYPAAVVARARAIWREQGEKETIG